MSPEAAEGVTSGFSPQRGPITTRRISSELKPAWLTTGATLLRRSRKISPHTAPSTPVVITA